MGIHVLPNVLYGGAWLLQDETALRRCVREDGERVTFGDHVTRNKNGKNR